MMDKKNAADLLDNLIGMVDDSGGRDYDTALKMGIEALTAQPDRITLTEDERRTLKKMRTFYNGSYAKLLDKLFVSAQPDHSGDVNGKVDLIYRQAAIDAIRTKYCPSDFMDDGVIDAFAEIIQDLPSAQPETAKRIVGKSRDGMTFWYQCDMCNEPVDVQDNYCRGCGRRLLDGE